MVQCEDALILQRVCVADSVCNAGTANTDTTTVLGGILDVDLAIGERGQGKASQVVAEGATPVLKVSVAAPSNNYVRCGIKGGEVRLQAH